MKTYDQFRKQKERYEAQIASLTAKLEKKEEEVSRLKERCDLLRKENYENKRGGDGFAALEKEAKVLKRQIATLENQIKKNQTSLLDTFSASRHKLIKDIRALHNTATIYQNVIEVFKEGLDHPIKLLNLIKEDKDVYHDYLKFPFRDDVMNVFGRCLESVLGLNNTIQQRRRSATVYVQNVINGQYGFSSYYLKQVPSLGNKDSLNDLFLLCQLTNISYHGTQDFHGYSEYGIGVVETFMNLKKEKKINAVFTILEFVYLCFTGKDSELIFQAVSSGWKSSSSKDSQILSEE